MVAAPGAHRTAPGWSRATAWSNSGPRDFADGDKAGGVPSTEFENKERQRVVARPDRGWAGLTRTESPVARIVAQGHTNKETAAHLFVSRETVNTHLPHVFTKLEVRSRVELARLVLDHETD
jgi:DNA-binding CsgD family transcriptional regulator